MKNKRIIGQRRGSRLILFLIVALMALCSGQTVFAASSEPSSTEPSLGFGGPDSSSRRLESDSLQPSTSFDLGFLKPWYAWKNDLQNKYGLALGAEYNMTYLTSNDRLAGADKDAAGGIFRFNVAWELLGRGTDHSGTLMFLVEHTHALGDDTVPSNFAGDSLGYVGISNLPYNTEGWRLNTLYWDQKFQGGKYEVVAGFLDVSDYVDVYPLVSPWTDFFNYALSIGVGALDLPNDGALGLAGGAWLTESVYAMAGFVDQNADATDPMEGFDTFSNDREYFKHFEIGWTGASQEAYFLNNVHLTLWHADERDELGVDDGWGGVLSFNHAIGDKWLAFIRAGWAEDGGSLLERSVSIGGGYTPGGLDSLGTGSQLGFGANWGRPNDALLGVDLDDQYALEAYYRLQVSRELSITPSVQLLIDPALNPDEDSLWVYGLRARLAF